MVRRSANGTILFQCDGLCRSTFDTGLVGSKHAFFRATNAATDAGWQHRKSANGWIQFCPTCATEFHPAVEATVQDSTKPETSGEGFGLLDEDGNPLTGNIGIDELEVQAGASSGADDD